MKGIREGEGPAHGDWLLVGRDREGVMERGH